MAPTTQSFISTTIGSIGLLLVGSADAFWFHHFDALFDMGCIVTFAAINGVHFVSSSVAAARGTAP
jgi:hypothetical protein